MVPESPPAPRPHRQPTEAAGAAEKRPAFANRSGEPAVPLWPEAAAEADEAKSAAPSALVGLAEKKLSSGVSAAPVGPRAGAEAEEVERLGSATSEASSVGLAVPVGPRAGAEVEEVERPGSAVQLSDVGDSDAARIAGVWQTDASQHASKGSAHASATTTMDPSVLVAVPDEAPFLRVAYFYSGVKRKASLAESLRRRCLAAKVALTMCEVDILVGGSGHDLLGKTSQRAWLFRVLAE